MADKRMFSQTIIDSDAFLDMPLSTQSLYFHLSMRADDDGFVNNPKKIQRLIGCGDDDLKLLMLKGFLIPFESGIVVIKHWKIHNYIRTDRYKETNYLEEKAKLGLCKNKSYTLIAEDKACTPLISSSNNGGRQMVDSLETQNRLDKNSIDKNSIDKNKQEKSVQSSSNSSKGNQEVFKHFEKCGFIITGMLMEQISEDVEVFSKDWLKEAATEAVTRGKINNYKYVLGILQNWQTRGRNDSNVKNSNDRRDLGEELREQGIGL